MQMLAYVDKNLAEKYQKRNENEIEILSRQFEMLITAEIAAFKIPQSAVPRAAK